MISMQLYELGDILNLLSIFFKETKSASMNIFRILFLFKSFVKVELSYAFTINMFTGAENCTEKWIIL